MKESIRYIIVGIGFMILSIISLIIQFKFDIFAPDMFILMLLIFLVGVGLYIMGNDIEKLKKNKKKKR